MLRAWERLETAAARLAATWIVEAVAIVFSLLCMVALVALLAFASGKEILVWQGITLNTLTSLLATAAKLSALYVVASAISQAKWNLFHQQAGSLLDFEAIELASRGALGSFQMLFQTRETALIGVAAFIVAVAFDPFAQQLIQYKTHVIFEMNGLATMPIATRYNRGSAYRVAATPSPGTRLADADFEMQSAVLSGLIQPISTVQQQTPLTCQSGNCTWSHSLSLSVCSLCDDLTPILTERVALRAPLYQMASYANHGAAMSNTTIFALPNGLWMNDEDGEHTSIQMTAFGSGNPADTVTMQLMDTLIWSISMIRVLDQEPMVWPNATLEASECALYYCVEDHSINVTSNRINDQATIQNDVRRAPKCWQPSEPEQLENISPDADRPAPGDDFALDGIDRTDLMLGDGFNVSQTAVYGIRSFFDETFRDLDLQEQYSCEGNITDLDPDYVAACEAQKRLTGVVIANETSRPATMPPLYDSSNLSATFESIAASMTNALRAGDDTASFDVGKHGRLITTYHIRWPWIALPLAVVLLSTIQLVSTVIGTKKSGAPLWKSSPLAIMSRGTYLDELLANSTTLLEMREAAGRRHVDLFDRKLDLISPRTE